MSTSRVDQEAVTVGRADVLVSAEWAERNLNTNSSGEGLTPSARQAHSQAASFPGEQR